MFSAPWNLLRDNIAERHSGFKFDIQLQNSSSRIRGKLKNKRDKSVWNKFYKNNYDFSYENSNLKLFLKEGEVVVFQVGYYWS